MKWCRPPGSLGWTPGPCHPTSSFVHWVAQLYHFEGHELLQRCLFRPCCGCCFSVSFQHVRMWSHLENWNSKKNRSFLFFWIYAQRLFGCVSKIIWLMPLFHFIGVRKKETNLLNHRFTICSHENHIPSFQ